MKRLQCPHLKLCSGAWPSPRNGVRRGGSSRGGRLRSGLRYCRRAPRSAAGMSSVRSCRRGFGGAPLTSPFSRSRRRSLLAVMDLRDLLCDLIIYGFLPSWGQRGLPSGREVNGPHPFCCSNACAILPVRARAMNPCGVAFGPVHLHNLSRVRGVPLDKPPVGKTCAVILDASKYLGASAPSSARGHRARSSLAGGPEARSSLALARGSVTGFCEPALIFYGRRVIFYGPLTLLAPQHPARQLSRPSCPGPTSRPRAAARCRSAAPAPPARQAPAATARAASLAARTGPGPEHPHTPGGEARPRAPSTPIAYRPQRAAPPPVNK